MSVPKSRAIEATPIAEDDELRSQRIERNRAGIALLDSWVDVSDEERADQIESWEFLKQALDEDRPADAKLFR